VIHAAVVLHTIPVVSSVGVVGIKDGVIIGVGENRGLTRTLVQHTLHLFLQIREREQAELGTIASLGEGLDKSVEMHLAPKERKERQIMSKKNSGSGNSVLQTKYLR